MIPKNLEEYYLDTVERIKIMAPEAYTLIINQGRRELLLSIVKEKFNGSVVEFLQWLGPFNDIDIDEEHLNKVEK